MRSSINRRDFVKRGALFLPAFSIFVPRLIRAAIVVPQTPAKGFVAAGGGTWTFGTSAENTVGTSAAPTVQLTGVGAGNFILIGLKYETDDTTSSCSDGTSALPGLTAVNHTNNDLSGRWFYLLSSVATGTVTYTVTLGASKDFVRMLAFRWSYTGTAAFDAECTGGGGINDSVTNHTSGANLTTTPTGSSGLAVSMYTNYSGETSSARQINAVGATDGTDSGGTIGFYRMNIAALTNAAATCTTGASASSVMPTAAWKLN